MTVEPLIVALGVVTQQEFDALRMDEQAVVESVTRRLITSYGLEAMRRDRERHRQDLAMVFGTLGPPTNRGRSFVRP